MDNILVGIKQMAGRGSNTIEVRKERDAGYIYFIKDWKWNEPT